MGRSGGNCSKLRYRDLATLTPLRPPTPVFCPPIRGGDASPFLESKRLDSSSSSRRKPRPPNPRPFSAAATRPECQIFPGLRQFDVHFDRANLSIAENGGRSSRAQIDRQLQNRREVAFDLDRCSLLPLRPARFTITGKWLLVNRCLVWFCYRNESAQTTPREDNLHQGPIGRARGVIREDEVPGHLHARGSRFKDQSARVESSGKLMFVLRLLRFPNRASARSKSIPARGMSETIGEAAAGLDGGPVGHAT